MKASLCKLSPCTVARVCDYHAKLFLVAVSSTLKSLLRPHFLNTPDKSPGDRLTEVCAKITDAGGCRPGGFGQAREGPGGQGGAAGAQRGGPLRPRARLPEGALTARPLPDIDKVMINLKTEEFVLDMNTLQALQQLLQWVGDFVLHLLASLPNQVRPHPTPARPAGPAEPPAPPLHVLAAGGGRVPSSSRHGAAGGAVVAGRASGKPGAPWPVGGGPGAGAAAW